MSRKTKADSDGGGLLGDAARISNQAQRIILLAAKWEAGQGAEYHLRSVSIYPPSATKAGNWLIVAKGWYGGYRMVAFHRAPDILTALVGFLERWYQGKLIWKKDEYASE